MPGYRAGDILAFSGRAANRGTRAASAVELSGTFDNPADFDAMDLQPGSQALYPAASYTVTDDDVAAGRAQVTFELHAAIGATPVVLARTFRLDTATGDVTITANPAATGQ